MLLVIEMPQVGFTASHYTRQPAPVLAIGVLDVSLNPTPARQKAGIEAGIGCFAGLQRGGQVARLSVMAARLA